MILMFMAVLDLFVLLILILLFDLTFVLKALKFIRLAHLFNIEKNN